jgi:hypothetical protein
MILISTNHTQHSGSTATPHSASTIAGGPGTEEIIRLSFQSLKSTITGIDEIEANFLGIRDM